MLLVSVTGIINLVNGNMYIGSGVVGRMQNRFHKHLYSLQGSSMVAAAIIKYGLNNFAFILIETVPNFDITVDNEDLLDLETHYITILPSSYNIARGKGKYSWSITHRGN